MLNFKHCYIFAKIRWTKSFEGARPNTGAKEEDLVKSHVWRPLYVVLLIIVGVLVVRKILVPADFGVGARGYMYGWHRPSNEEDWKKVSVKYRTAEYCKGCHKEKYEEIKQSPHANINCENCHNPELECVTCHWPHDPRKAGHATKTAAAPRNPADISLSASPDAGRWTRERRGVHDIA